MTAVNDAPKDYDEAMTHRWNAPVSAKETTPITLSVGAVYDMSDGSKARVLKFSSSCVLYELLDRNTHPFRIVRRSDGKLLGVYHQRPVAVEAWDTWYRDGSHA